MSEEQLKAFQAAVEADARLQEKVKAASDADAVVGIAKAAGFAISAEELLRAQAEEISEAQDLEAIVGGKSYGPAGFGAKLMAGFILPEKDDEVIVN